MFAGFGAAAVRRNPIRRPLPAGKMETTQLSKKDNGQHLTRPLDLPWNARLANERTLMA
jgi:hypothetical protein